MSSFPTRRPVIVLLLSLLAAVALFSIRGAGPVAGMDAAPPTVESTRAQELLDQAPDHEMQQVMAVITRADGGVLTPADLAAAKRVGEEMANTAAERSSAAAADAPADAPKPVGPIPSEDGKAAIVGAPINTEPSTAASESQRTDENSQAVDETVAALRAVAKQTAQDEQANGAGELTVSVTGGPAIGSDIRGAFAGANFTLLAVTVGVVALLLLLTYRSPILWILPLAVVATADGAAGAVTARLGEQFDLAFDAGVISVLVFGAGANYALLLISRYREELAVDPDHRAALSRAWKAVLPAILTSNITVVLSLLTLLAALMPATRGLGIAAAAGLLIALLAVVFPLTALLALVGRSVFWPFIPRPSAAGDTREATSSEGNEPRGVFAWTARHVVAHPAMAMIGALAVLAVGASGLIGTRIGLSQMEQFATASEARSGLETMAEHYPAGEAAPHLMVVSASTPKDAQAAAEKAITAAESVPGIQRAHPSGEPFEAAAAGGSTRTIVPLSATGTAEPESSAANAEVAGLRSALNNAGIGTGDGTGDGADSETAAAATLVGGSSAAALDVHNTSVRDLWLIAPMIVAVVLVLLAVLLRSVVAPVILMVLTGISTVSALGIGTWIGEQLFNWPGLDITVPLIAFLFLVALGVDYSIFLSHRVKQENQEHSMGAALVRAVSHTGVVITSAGVVLAAVFAALGVLPLVVLGQLGLIVGLGVLLDTLLVRTVLVPAVFTLVGERIWWPSRA